MIFSRTKYQGMPRWKNMSHLTWFILMVENFKSSIFPTNLTQLNFYPQHTWDTCNQPCIQRSWFWFGERKTIVKWSSENLWLSLFVFVWEMHWYLSYLSSRERCVLIIIQGPGLCSPDSRLSESASISSANDPSQNWDYTRLLCFAHNYWLSQVTRPKSVSQMSMSNILPTIIKYFLSTIHNSDTNKYYEPPVKTE